MVSHALNRVAAVLCRVLVTGLLAGLAGCGPIVNLGGSAPPANIYRLTPVSAEIAEPPAAEWRIRIAPPTAGGALDTSRIAVAPGPLEIQYYAEARWAERVPEMVQALLVDSLEAGAGAVALTADSSVSFAPYVLEPDIREFQADVSNASSPRVNVRIAFRLMRPGRDGLLASTTLTASADATGDNVHEIVRAFNAALQQVLREAVSWTADRVRAAEPA